MSKRGKRKQVLTVIVIVLTCIVLICVIEFWSMGRAPNEISFATKQAEGTTYRISMEDLDNSYLERDYDVKISKDEFEKEMRANLRPEDGWTIDEYLQAIKKRPDGEIICSFGTTEEPGGFRVSVYNPSRPMPHWITSLLFGQ